MVEYKMSPETIVTGASKPDFNRKRIPFGEYDIIYTGLNDFRLRFPLNIILIMLILNLYGKILFISDIRRVFLNLDMSCTSPTYVVPICLFSPECPYTPLSHYGTTTPIQSYIRYVCM